MDNWLLTLQKAGRAWVRFDQFHLNVYLRWSKQYLTATERVATLEIANITVDTEKRHQGHFRAFLQEMEDIARKHNRVLFIENVLEEQFLGFFIHRGYSVLQRNPPCAFLVQSN